MSGKPVPQNTTLIVPMSLGSRHIWLRTSCSTSVLVPVSPIGAICESVAILAFSSASVVFGASIVTGLELYGTTFSDQGNMPRIFTPIKPVPRRMFTASLSMMWNICCVMESPMGISKSMLPVMPTEYFAARRRCTFPVACRRVVQFSSEKAFVIKIFTPLCSITIQLGAVCFCVFGRRRILNRPICL